MHLDASNTQVHREKNMSLVRYDDWSPPRPTDQEHFMTSHQQEPPLLSYSVGVMAYNEEANIQQTLTALLAQESKYTRLSEVIVVASGCTDQTSPA